MLNRTKEEALRLAIELEAKKLKVLSEYAFFIEKIGQMTHNIERMEREGTTGMPALDAKSPENAGKTQYGIDHSIRESYMAQAAELKSKYPEVWKEG